MDVQPPYDAAQARAVIGALQGCGQKWLLVYDNVEVRADLDGLIPDKSCRHIHLIITTREKDGWAGFDLIEADKLSTEEPNGPAVALLLREAGKPDDGKARDLARALDGLPLALIVAGGLIRDFDSYGDYLNRLDEIIAAAPKSGDYPDAVIGAVRASYDKLGDDAKWLIDVMAWWAAEGLAVRLFTDAPAGEWWDNHKDTVPADLAELCGDAARVRAGFADLCARSLLTRADGGFTLHRMSAAALRTGERAEEAAKAAAALLMSVYPGGERNPAHSPNWPECKRLTPHVQAIFATGHLPATAAMDTLLNQAGIYLLTIGDIKTGRDFARESLTLKEARLGPEDAEVAFGHHNLGMALSRAGDLDGAEAAMRRAVALRERHRPGSADLADSHAGLGSVFLARMRGGDKTAAGLAGEQFETALSLREDLFGRDSEPVAHTLNNLAVLRDAMGDLDAAAELAEEALAIRRRGLQKGDARLGYPLLNAGAYALKSGAAGRAEALLTEALDLWEAAHAERPDHPDRRDAAGWLISALLVNARAGDGARTEKARDLADRYGFDWAEMQAMAAQYPDPTDQPPI